MKKRFLLSGLFLGTVAVVGCGGKNEETKEEPKSKLEALQEFANKAEEMQKKEPVEPVDFRELKNLLPETAAGIARKEASGEKNGTLGFTVSQANAEYEGADNETRITLEILDTGGIGGFGALGVAVWAMAETDKESESGYEKTLKIGGHKAFEKYDNQQKHGEVKLLVADRYVVNIEGDNVTMDQLKTVLKSIDLSKLEKLK